MSDFYVYALFDAFGVVRYIGKGKNSRWTQHTTNKKSRKSFIEQAVALLGDVPRVKIREGLSEFAAYKLENDLIRAIGREPAGPLVNRTDNGSGPNSKQVRDWHARKTHAERQAHIAPAVAASAASEVSREGKRRTIRIALAALTPEHHLAAAERLNRNYTHERHKVAGVKGKANMTSEAKSDAARKAIASQTKEQLSEIGRRRNFAMSAETRSEGARKRSAKVTPEQRVECNNNLRFHTKEQLSENGKKGAAALTREQRVASGKRRLITLSPERRREISLIAVAAKAKKRKARFQADAIDPRERCPQP